MALANWLWAAVVARLDATFGATAAFGAPVSSAVVGRGYSL